MDELITTPTFIGGLRDLGVKLGNVLLVYSSLSNFGHVQGNAQKIKEALGGSRTAGNIVDAYIECRPL